MSEPSREEAEANDIIVAYFDSHGINNARAGAFNILDRLKDGGLTVRRAAKPERERVIEECAKVAEGARVRELPTATRTAWDMQDLIVGKINALKGTPV